MDKDEWNIEGRTGLIEVLGRLSDEQLQLLIVFTQQLLETSSPDVMRHILTWRRDERIASLLDIASEIDDDDLDQLLFIAEDFYADVVRSL